MTNHSKHRLFPRFLALSKGSNKQLQELQITIVICDEINRNFNGGTISRSQLTRETVWLKSVIKRKGKLTVCKIHTAIGYSIGDNITLDDSHLHNNQLRNRVAQQPARITPTQLPSLEKQ